MKTKFYIIGAVISLVIVLIFISIENNNPPVTTSQEIVSNYELYETSNSKEFVDFLNKLDTSKEIVSISCSTYKRQYANPVNIYTVTYTSCEKTDKTDVKYEYFVFETDGIKEYGDFIDNLDPDYEIVDISTTTYAAQYTNPTHRYIVTYRKCI